MECQVPPLEQLSQAGRGVGGKSVHFLSQVILTLLAEDPFLDFCFSTKKKKISVSVVKKNTKLNAFHSNYKHP